MLYTLFRRTAPELLEKADLGIPYTGFDTCQAAGDVPAPAPLIARAGMKTCAIPARIISKKGMANWLTATALAAHLQVDVQDINWHITPNNIFVKLGDGAWKALWPGEVASSLITAQAEGLISACYCAKRSVKDK